jgi:D-alanyl-D-alanine carboxypeptidase
VERDADGQIVQLFSLPSNDLRWLLYPVSVERALPDDWAPPDLSWRLGKPLREIVVGDTAELLSGAAADGISLTIASSFRPASYQASLYNQAVARWLSRSTPDDPIELDEAERRAGRFIARPNHSQHQLGTAIDFSGAETGFTLGPAFARTTMAGWLARRGWEYGFVLPYTEAGSTTTGYAFEPWHLRWVGRPLAALLEAENYRHSQSYVADRYLEAIERWLDGAGVPPAN